MHPDSTTYLGFEWEGHFYQFVVLPFGLSTAPRIFTLVMAHTVKFLRFKGVRLFAYLDDLVFAHASKRETLAAAQLMLHILPRFGWLVHPTKCQGCFEGLQTFIALGTVVCLATHTYRVSAETLARILRKANSLVEGPRVVPVRKVAQIKGTISATWVSTGTVTRLRTREMDSVIESRPRPTSASSRCLKRSWAASVTLSDACLDELRWWIHHLPSLPSQPIRPKPLDGVFDGTMFSDASDTGVGAVLEAPVAGPSTFMEALLARAPEGVHTLAVEQRARQGLEFMAPLPANLLDASSTLRELHGLAVFIAAVWPLLGKGRFRVVMDNLGCVFILGGVVPPFAVGGKAWGEFVSGGSPNPDLQRLALRIHDSQLEHGYELVAEWRPRDENVRADFLSHVAEMRHHDYRLIPRFFRMLDMLWGPHTVDRFASADNCQPLSGRFAGRFCSQFFHPAALWVDALSVPWSGDEVNWLFPPTHLVTQVVSHLLVSRAVGTLIVTDDPGAEWWPSLRRCSGWIPAVIASRTLGPALAVLTSVGARYRSIFRSRDILALRLDGRHGRAPYSP